MTCSTRSSITPALETHRDRLVVIARALGATHVDREEAYPGWAPNPDRCVVCDLRGSRDSSAALGSAYSAGDDTCDDTRVSLLAAVRCSR